MMAIKNWHVGKIILLKSGGSRIRTHEEVTPLTVFKTAAIDHSAIPPQS
jgi:hypothetical protein